MRRSRSQSLLPVPKRSSIRSSSTARCSSVSNLAVTPLSHRGTSSLSLTPSTASKLFNNKQWVHEQHVKVQKYIRDNPHLFANKVNPDLIKPPTIKTFVDLVSILFKKLQIKVNITESNYKDIVPVHMKILLYKGTITPSTMRLVPSSIGFPQTIAMLAYLVDTIEMITHEEEDEDDVLKKLMEDYGSHTTDENESFDINNLEYAASLAGVNLEEYNQAKSDIEYLNNTVILLKKRQKELLEENKALEEETSKMEQEIEVMKHDGAMIKKEDEKQYQKLITLNKELKESKDLLNSKVNCLTESINNQPCTSSEREEILKKIEELTIINALQSERLNVVNEVNQNREQQLKETFIQITQIIRNSNTNLMKVSYEFPELKQFEFPEEDFLDSETKIANIVQKSKQFVEDVLSKKASLAEDLKKEEEALDLRLEIISKSHEEISILRKTVKQIEEHNKLLKSEQSKLLLEIDQEIEAENLRIKQIEDDARKQKENLALVLASLQEKSSEVKNRMKLFAEHSKHSAITLNNECVRLLKEIDLLKVAREDKIAEIVEYKIRRFLNKE